MRKCMKWMICYQNLFYGYYCISVEGIFLSYLWPSSNQKWNWWFWLIGWIIIGSNHVVDIFQSSKFMCFGTSRLIWLEEYCNILYPMLHIHIHIYWSIEHWTLSDHNDGSVLKTNECISAWIKGVSKKYVGAYPFFVEITNKSGPRGFVMNLI